MRYLLLLFIIFLTSQAWAAESLISQITEAIEQAPPDSKFQYYHFRARAYSRKNMHEAALADLTASINLNPTISAYRERTEILIKMGRYQEAINDLNILLKDDPDNLQMYRLRSKAHFEVEQYKESMADAKQVLAEEPNDMVSRLIVMESATALAPEKDIIMDTRHEYVPLIRRVERQVPQKPARLSRRAAARSTSTTTMPRTVKKT